MPIVAYTSKVKIEHLAVPNNKAILPPDGETVLFGVHDEIADHYKLVPGTFEPYAATLDYIIASVGGCLTGTFGGALAGRGVVLGEKGLTADVTGEIEREDDNVLVIKRIHVQYHLSASSEFKEKILRAYEVHAAKCPVYRSLTPGITITTELDWKEQQCSPSIAMSNEHPSNPEGSLYYRHSLPVRIMHWIAVLSLPILLMSGLNIFNANPELYLGKSSYNGSPPLLELRSKVDNEGEVTEGVTRLFGYEFNTTGFLGASNDMNGELVGRGFPSWLTLPSYQWLAMARRWHLFFAWVFAINSFCFVCYSIYSRHLQKDLLPTRQDWQSIDKTIRDHILFRHPTGEASKSYNVLQKVAYIGVIFLLFPLVVINGLGMSPGIDALIPGWVDVFGGRQSMRTIHFIISWGLVAFTAVHLFQVIITGFLNNIRSMITGNYRIKTESEHEPE